MAASPPFFYWSDARKWHLSLPVTSHSYDTREGIVSHVWYEILRLSPHLFWLFFFSHRAFLSVQDDDTGEQLVARRGIFLQVHKKRASWKRYAFLCCGIADDLIMIASAFPVDYFPVSLFVLPVDVPKEE